MVNWGGRTLARGVQRPWYSRVQAERGIPLPGQGRATQTDGHELPGTGSRRCGPRVGFDAKRRRGRMKPSTRTPRQWKEPYARGATADAGPGRRTMRACTVHKNRRLPVEDRRQVSFLPGVINSGAFGSFASFVTVACSKKLLRVHESERSVEHFHRLMPTAQEIRTYLEKNGIQAALTTAVNEAIQAQAPNALEFIGDSLKAKAASGGAAAAKCGGDEGNTDPVGAAGEGTAIESAAAEGAAVEEAAPEGAAAEEAVVEEA
eukprot:scaffold13572_cov52-Phaeocystis_antarctica.AAC.1